MSLAPGGRLGPYEILAPVGAGGMGEVFRATDTRLGREVAIKVLATEVARDPERLARFEREAKLLASLNHPNIAHVYGFETAADPDGAAVHLLAMELVPGEDLADRLRRGPIPVDEALEIAKQIAEALAEAHDSGIVHRDLKPANVKVTPDGEVKVLDFGLAKAYAAEPASGVAPQLSQSPTLANEATQAGTILGTAAYMSPEQARGRPVDRRTDLWAFGVVLWEMLTGQRLFAGETVSDILAGVLKTEVDWSQLPAATPGPVVRLLRRCLTRDRRKRLADASDARLEIEEASVDEAGSAAGASPVARPSRTAAAAIAAVALAAGALLAWAAFQRTLAPRRAAARLEMAGVLFHTDSIAAISPDGRRVAFVPQTETRSGELSVRELGDYTSRIVPGTEYAVNPFFSPDGQSVGYLRGGRDEGLFVVSLAGGFSQRVAGASASHGEAGWTDDGRIVGSSLEVEGARWRGLAIVPATGGDPRPLTTPSAEEREHRHPLALPGGRWALFTVVRGGGFAIDAVSLEDGRRHRVADDVSTPAYSPTGHLLFYRPSDLTLLGARFDADEARLDGETVVLLPSVRRLPEGRGGYALSASGTLIYTTDSGDSALTGAYALVRVDRKGAVSPLLEHRDTWAQPRFSPDGRTLVVRQTATPDCTLWTIDVARGISSRLTLSGDFHDPIWAADGAGILASAEKDVRQIVARGLDAEASERQLTRGPVDAGHPTASPDGLVVYSAQTRDGSDLLYTTLDGSGEPRTFASTRFDESLPELSPDGHWIAYVSDESGRDEVYLRPFPGPGAKVQVSTDGGSGPRWSRDGAELFYESPQQRLMVAGVGGAPQLRVSAPQALFGGPFVWDRPGNYDVAPDGESFVMVQRATDDSSAPPSLRVVLDFSTELEQRLPR